MQNCTADLNVSHSVAKVVAFKSFNKNCNVCSKAVINLEQFENDLEELL